jgi:uncharacterized protein (TIGR02300 family)
VTKPEWGSKHICQSCKTKYYDFLKSPITCPKCGTALDAGNSRKKVAAESNVVDIKATEEEVDDLDDVAEFPDEEELVHIDDSDDDDSEDDEDLQSVSASASGRHSE